jgi:nitrogen fixation NifU-like protein
MQFSAQSCALCKASASIMCESLQAKTVTEVNQDVEHFLNILQGNATDVLPELNFFSAVRNFPARAKCVILPWKTLQAALVASPHESLNSKAVVSTEV